MALFESYERRIDKITSVLNSYGIASIEEAEKITKDAGLDVYAMVKGIQPICFENACWAYTVGAAIARLDRNLLELSLTVLVRMLLRLSQELTDSHSLRQRWIIQQAK